MVFLIHMILANDEARLERFSALMISNHASKKNFATSALLLSTCAKVHWQV